MFTTSAARTYEGTITVHTAKAGEHTAIVEEWSDAVAVFIETPGAVSRSVKFSTLEEAKAYALEALEIRARRTR